MLSSADLEQLLVLNVLNVPVPKLSLLLFPLPLLVLPLLVLPVLLLLLLLWLLNRRLDTHGVPSPPRVPLVQEKAPSANVPEPEPSNALPLPLPLPLAPRL